MVVMVVVIVVVAEVEEIVDETEVAAIKVVAPPPLEMVPHRLVRPAPKRHLSPSRRSPDSSSMDSSRTLGERKRKRNRKKSTARSEESRAEATTPSPAREHKAAPRRQIHLSQLAPETRLHPTYRTGHAVVVITTAAQPATERKEKQIMTRVAGEMCRRPPFLPDLARGGGRRCTPRDHRERLLSKCGCNRFE
jgi:hypothetical protein